MESGGVTECLTCGLPAVVVEEYGWLLLVRVECFAGHARITTRHEISEVDP